MPRLSDLKFGVIAASGGELPPSLKPLENAIALERSERETADSDLTAWKNLIEETLMAQLLINEEMAAQLKRLQFQIDVQPLVDRIATLEAKPDPDLSPLSTKAELGAAVNTLQNEIAGEISTLADRAAGLQTALGSTQALVEGYKTATGDRITALSNAMGATSARVDVLIDRLNKLLGWDTTVEIDTGLKYNGKPIYSQVFNGTTPNNGSDNTLFTIPGATMVINYNGYYKESNANRYNDIGGSFSGSFAHGQMFKFYIGSSGAEFHAYNATGDSRHQGCQYLVRTLYVK